MKNLIEALTILLKYGDNPFPTHCEHDVLYLYPASGAQISKEDLEKLKELSFIYDEETNGFSSFLYGSC